MKPFQCSLLSAPYSISIEMNNFKVEKWMQLVCLLIIIIEHSSWAKNIIQFYSIFILKDSHFIMKDSYWKTLYKYSSHRERNDSKNCSCHDSSQEFRLGHSFVKWLWKRIGTSIIYFKTQNGHQKYIFESESDPIFGPLDQIFILNINYKGVMN